MSVVGGGAGWTEQAMRRRSSGPSGRLHGMGPNGGAPLPGTRKLPRWVKVLMYHRVVPDGAPGGEHAVSVSTFRRQMQMLDLLECTPVTFRDLALHARDELTLPRRPVVLTFDDGYTDLHERVGPVLEEMAWNAVVFALGDPRVNTSRWDRGGPHGEHSLMGDAELRDLARIGFEIGSHTLTHPDLTSLGIHRAWEEVTLSKKALEDRLGEEVASFSYPFGRHDGTIRSLVAAAGYRFACGVYTGPASFSSDPFDIRRLAIGSNVGEFGFLNRLRLPYGHLESAWNGVRRLLEPLRAIPGRLP